MGIMPASLGRFPGSQRQVPRSGARNLPRLPRCEPPSRGYPVASSGSLRNGRFTLLYSRGVGRD
ncbi:hypothetical protein AB395_00002244 [Sinorhizobium fredii CCBAU 45436]|nr:hypothetical protein AB395_00002244 [Sinorhizobium fredii CCBAU 45436]AWM25743.1 hypothetical protein AOX55_00002492 [Sinorhizobium fredii CCBAU 25509]